MAKTTQELATSGAFAYEQTVWMSPKSVYNKERVSGYFAMFALIAADISIMCVALSVAFLIRIDVLPSISSSFSTMPSQNLLDELWLAIFACIICIAYEGLYTKRLRFWQETRHIIRATSLSVILVLATISLGKFGDSMSRTVLVMGYCFAVILLPLGRQSIRAVMTHMGIGVEPVIILGAGRTGIAVGNALVEQKHLCYRVAGFLDEDPQKQRQVILLKNKAVSVLGNFRDTDKVMVQTGARHLIVAAPGMPSKTMTGLINRLQREAVSVTVISSLHGVPVMGVEADNALGDKMLSLHFKNNLARPYNRLIKRSFDLLVGSILLFMLAPLLLAIGLAIKIDSPGPVVFFHKRVRMHAKSFGCYKFRTMHVNSQEILKNLLVNDPRMREEWERDFKLKEDPRITRFGKLLRKTSLDELPQILNVLKGEMSLVGPRPVVDKEIERFGFSVAYYFMVRPGITGLWQVSGRNDIDYDARVDLEAWYVRNWSMWLDITILIRTTRAVFARTGAY